MKTTRDIRIKITSMLCCYLAYNDHKNAICIEMHRLAREMVLRGLY